MASLGRLTPVDLREVWKDEAADFTPWLAQEENLKRLADTIGLELELESTEKSVGPFRADIVCKDTITDDWVLIENQLERTNHSHLGQLITYTAGLKAVTIVWIAKRFTDEHRAALDWLNEVTDSEINFFGLEIRLWRIGDSQIAPEFDIISKPNDWTKTIAAARQATIGEISETRQLHLEYWTVFKDYLESKGSFIQARKPRPQHWYNFAVGRTGFRLTAMTGMRGGYIVAQMVMHDEFAKSYFHLLSADREAIETELGFKPEWRELPNNKQSDISIYRYDVDPTNRDHWQDYHTWLRQQLETLHRVFAPRITRLNADDYQFGGNDEDDNNIDTEP